MNCTEIQKRISARLDGELEAEESGMIDRHLAACAACRRVRDQLEWGYTRIDVEDPPPPDPWLAARVRARLADSTAKARSRVWAGYRLLIPVTMAAGLLLGMTLGQHLSEKWPAQTQSTSTAELTEVQLMNQLPSGSLTTSYLDLSWLEGAANE